MAGDDSETEDGGPVATFQSYIAEGDILAKQGEFRKSIEAYSKVSEFNCFQGARNGNDLI